MVLTIFWGVVLAVAHGAQRGALDDFPPQVRWFNATLDHFTYDSTAQFRQKYLVYDKWWFQGSSSQPSGPILFYFGNEGGIEDFYNNTGFMFELAPDLQALIVFLEHRYYGDTLPFGNRSYDTNYLRYLSIEQVSLLAFINPPHSLSKQNKTKKKSDKQNTQALADTALFLANKESELGCQLVGDKGGCDTVLFGGSYGGMLSAWFRLKYPHLAVGALAASAPVDLYPGEGKDKAFYNATLHVYEKYGGNQGTCAGWLDKALSRIVPLSGTPSGLALLTRTLAPCSPVKTQLDAERLLFYMQGAVATLCLFDYPYSTTFMTPLPANAVEVACNLSTPFINPNNDTELLWGLNIIANVFLNWTGQLPCHNISKELLANPSLAPSLSSSSASSSSSLLQADLGDITRPWNYQACTELILEPLTSDGFGFYVESDEQIASVERACRLLFSDKLVTRPLWMLQAFGSGSQLVKAISNTIFSDGEKDPWRVGSVPDNAQELNPSVIHLYIEAAAHHQDLRFSDPADPPTLFQAKAQERDLIHQWLKR